MCPELSLLDQRVGTSHLRCERHNFPLSFPRMSVLVLGLLRSFVIAVSKELVYSITKSSQDAT